jgi:hypothetical protein
MEIITRNGRKYVTGENWTQDLDSNTMPTASPNQSNHKTQIIWKRVGILLYYGPRMNFKKYEIDREKAMRYEVFLKLYMKYILHMQI